MKRVNIQDLPANATAYELDDGRIYRMHLTLMTPTSKLNTVDYVEVETKGYRIDKSGAFMVDENQEPIMLAPQRARVPLGNIRTGSDTAKPGWVRQNLPEDENERAEVTKGVKKLKNLPKEGVVGDAVMVGDEMFGYSDGVYERVRMARLESLPQEAAATPLDDATIQSLIP